jgi:hypothetical protein
MRYVIIFLVIIIFTSLVQADTTFFDNPGDVFIINGSATGGVTGGIIIIEEQQPNGGGVGCLYKWNCTNWSECLSSEKQIRDCTNIGTCPDTYKTPEIEQNCTYITPEIKEKGGEKEETEDRNRTFVYSIIILIILSIVFYLTKDYFRKLIKKTK